jgi:predicted lipoprotein with Yx(FWY)xxD motif
MRSRPYRRLIALLALPTLLAVSVTGAQAHGHAVTRAAAVKVVSANILVTGKGMTLYVFAPDKKNKSTCYGKCATFWPPLLAANGATPPAHMAGIPGTFGVTMRTDGTHQITYDGAPLYTFLEDKKPGQMNGQGLDVAGGYWWVVVAGGH